MSEQLHDKGADQECRKVALVNLINKTMTAGRKAYNCHKTKMDRLRGSENQVQWES